MERQTKQSLNGYGGWKAQLIGNDNLLSTFRHYARLVANIHIWRMRSPQSTGSEHQCIRPILATICIFKVVCQKSLTVDKHKLGVLVEEKQGEASLDKCLADPESFS